MYINFVQINKHNPFPFKNQSVNSEQGNNFSLFCESHERREQDVGVLNMKNVGFQGINLNCFNFLSLVSCSLILLASLGPYDDDDEGNLMRSPNREKERNQNKILT